MHVCACGSYVENSGGTSQCPEHYFLTFPEQRLLKVFSGEADSQLGSSVWKCFVHYRQFQLPSAS